MSYYDEASLVMIPSGYKTSKVYSIKPTDGSGDLSFTRSNDTATRVGPDGLIEKVRTNVILQSNTFNVTWLPTDATITSGATDPNGGTTAWTLANTAASGIIQQAATLTGLRSVSIYAKQGTHRYLYMGAYTGSGTDSYQVFDLQTGTITNGSKGRIESVGGGWYRCTSFGADGTTGGVQIFPSNNSLGAGTTNGNILIWRCQYETGDLATDYIATTTAAVSVGPVANVPRLDYLNSSCPRLLLEPQRTNLVFFSEQLNNAGWAAGAVVTANTAVSPDGYTNADSVMEAGINDYQILGDPVTTVSGTAYTFSFFAKPNGRNFARILFGNGSFPDDEFVYFNLLTGGITKSSLVQASMVSYGNGWYRCIATLTSNANATDAIYFGPARNMTDGYAPYTGNTSAGIYAFGVQQEAGAYATSYIPTLGAAVTRGADAASKTGISSLIGQTEGVLFWQMEIFNAPSANNEDVILIDNGSLSNLIYITKAGTNAIIADVYVGSVRQAFFQTSVLPQGTYKCAIGYANNNIAFFVNGQQIGTTDTSCSIGAMSRIMFGTSPLGDSFSRTGQVLLFPTRLSNADLAALTA